MLICWLCNLRVYIRRFYSLCSKALQNSHLAHTDQYAFFVLLTRLPPNQILSPGGGCQLAYVQVLHDPELKVQVLVFLIFSLIIAFLKLFEYFCSMVTNSKKEINFVLFTCPSVAA